MPGEGVIFAAVFCGTLLLGEAIRAALAAIQARAVFRSSVGKPTFSSVRWNCRIAKGRTM